MVTPICPHSLNQRSIIFAADDEIMIEMKDNKSSSGRMTGSLKNDSARVATFDGESFCEVVTGRQNCYYAVRAYIKICQDKQNFILRENKEQNVVGDNYENRQT